MRGLFGARGLIEEIRYLLNTGNRLKAAVRSRGVMVSTLDFESRDLSSSLGGTSFFVQCIQSCTHPILTYVRIRNIICTV